MSPPRRDRVLQGPVVLAGDLSQPPELLRRRRLYRGRLSPGDRLRRLAGLVNRERTQPFEHLGDLRQRARVIASAMRGPASKVGSSTGRQGHHTPSCESWSSGQVLTPSLDLRGAVCPSAVGHGARHAQGLAAPRRPHSRVRRATRPPMRDGRSPRSCIVDKQQSRRDYRLPWWLLRKARGALGASAEALVVGECFDRVPPHRAAVAVQAASGAVVCLWSLSRLWVAVISRHSERQAALPRRWKRSILRLNLVSAKTGSIIALRLR